MVDSSREAFHKWAEEAYGGDARRFFERQFDPNIMDEEEYKHADVQAAWEAWQVSRSAAIEECAAWVDCKGYKFTANELRRLKGEG